MYPERDLSKPFESDDEVLSFAVELAVNSAEIKGGPFGAVVTDAVRKVISVGVNTVIASQDATSHAEINAIRQAHKVLGMHNLQGCRLYTSCAPCIMCFGAIYWSGIQEVYAAAPKKLAEATGFKEGPINDRLWAKAKKDKGIEFQIQAPTNRDINLPFETFKKLGGQLY